MVGTTKGIFGGFMVLLLIWVCGTQSIAQVTPCGRGGRITVKSDTLCSAKKDTLRLRGQEGKIVAWQYRTENQPDWHNVNDTNAVWVTPEVTQKMFFRAVVQKTNCNPLYSDTAVRVLETNTAYLSGQSSACQNQNQGVIKLEGTKQRLIRWESSVDNFQTKNVLTPTTITLAYYNLSQSTAFRAVWRDCRNAEKTTDPVRVTVERCETCFPPHNLRATAVSSQEVTLAWDYTGGYQVFQSRYRLLGTNTWQPVEARISERSFRWRGLLTCEKYEFSIATLCGDSLSAWSVPCTVAVLGDIPNPRIEQIQDQSVMVKWFSVGLTTAKYQVRYRVLGSGNWIETASNITTLERRLIGLRAQTTYEVQVRTFCPQGYAGAWTTDPLIFRTTGAVLHCNQPPVGITLSVVQPESNIKVSWQTIPDAMGYEISYGAKGTAPSSWRSITVCAPENSAFLPNTPPLPATVVVRVRSYCNTCTPNAVKSAWSRVVEWKRP